VRVRLFDQIKHLFAADDEEKAATAEEIADQGRRQADEAATTADAARREADAAAARAGVEVEGAAADRSRQAQQAATSAEAAEAEAAQDARHVEEVHEARVVQEQATAERAAAADAARGEAIVAVARAAAVVGERRRSQAPVLAAAVQRRLADLALAKAKVAIQIGESDPGDDVAFLLALNPGLPAATLAKAASGGELARTMLALRLVVGAQVPTLVFDEVDAGVGGSAARAVGRSLAALAEHKQVLVVTHLPQVAAFADAQVALTKHDDGSTTVMRAELLGADGRVRELARMLSGLADSDTGQDHAEELLATAAAERGR